MNLRLAECETAKGQNSMDTYLVPGYKLKSITLPIIEHGPPPGRKSGILPTTS